MHPVLPRLVGSRSFLVTTVMKDFSNASFPPEVISVMEVALDAAVASLPEPVHSSHVQALAEAILREAHGGERDPAVLQRFALDGIADHSALIVGRLVSTRLPIDFAATGFHTVSHDRTIIGAQHQPP